MSQENLNTSKAVQSREESSSDAPIDEVGIAGRAIEILRRDKTIYQYPYIFVTRKVAFNIRFLLEQLRKNYWGIFDKDEDPISGKKLTWVPLTEWIVDTHVSNSAVTTDNFKFKANNTGAIGFVMIVKHLVKNWLNKIVFGEPLQNMQRELAINGSHVWKTYKSYDEDGKPCVETRDVDILNIYFDFTSKSIQAAYHFMERAILTKYECKAMDGWLNVDKIVPVQGLHPLDPNLSNAVTSTSMYIDVWELWGKIPKSLITGKKNDDQTEIDGHIVVSGLQSKGNELVHLIEENPGGKKPYEEFHTKRIAGRWLGRGPAESIMMMQAWLNTIVNIRKLRHQLSQLGIFKVKKGSPVSPQILTRMAANGVIYVNSMDDIQQMVVNEVSSSNMDEGTATDWARKVTNSWAAITGEQPVGAGRNAVAIFEMERNAGATSFSQFNIAIGFGIQKWMKRLVLPILMETLDASQVMAITGDPDEIETLDEQIVNHLAMDKLKDLEKKGKFVTMDIVNKEIANARTKLRKMGRDRFISLKDEIDLMDYESTFFLNTENFNEQEMVKNLLQVLQLAPQYADSTLRQIYDTMGLDISKLDEIKAKLAEEQAQAKLNPADGQPQPNNPGEAPVNPGQPMSVLPIKNQLKKPVANNARR